jgi:hypothetical protein
MRSARRAAAMSELQAVLASDSRAPNGQTLTPEERIALAYQLLREQLAMSYYRLAGYL